MAICVSGTCADGRAKGKFLRCRKLLPETLAEARLVQFIPFKRLRHIKQRAGMIRDGL
jgi:hypothetical protein